ncbi:MAG TPA: hypothetical protein VFP68_23155 [Burkholderiaceae bacterium]|nr:hypothetical protein [Burkholderiaceae bacterium]
MTKPWKPGQPIRPYEPLYDMDPHPKKGGRAVAWSLLQIAVGVAALVWGLNYLFRPLKSISIFKPANSRQLRAAAHNMDRVHRRWTAMLRTSGGAGAYRSEIG